MSKDRSVTQQNQRTRRSALFAWALLAVLVSVVLVLIRILPIGGPSIFSDEYTYAAWASALFHGTKTPPPLTLELGGWLYLHVYEVVFVGRGNFLVNARIENAVISALGAGALVFSFRLAVRQIKPLLYFILSVCVATALLGDYSAYFMPDAMYLALVCLWLLAVTLHAERPGVWFAVAIGVAGGLATMTKAHGILMLPVVVLVFIAEGIGLQRGWKATFADCVALIVCWLACTTAIGYFLGQGSINPIGSLYSNLGIRTVEHIRGYNISNILQLTVHHVVTLILVFGLPLFLCIWLALVALFRAQSRGYSSTLQYPSLALAIALLGMVSVTIIFTISMEGSGVGQTLTRLYGRYYEHFALLGSCFGILGSRRILIGLRLWIRLTTLVLFLILLIVAWHISFAIVGQYPIDFATAYGVYGLHSGRWLALAITGTAATLAMLLPKRAPAVLGIALLIWLTIDAVSMEQARWSMIEPAAGRVAAIAAQASSSDTTIEIVGPGYTIPVLRAGFYLLKDRVHFALGADATRCGNDSGTPDWVVSVEGAGDPCGYRNAIRIEDASAARQAGISDSTAVGFVYPGFHAMLRLEGQPEISRDYKVIAVTVSVSNDGSEEFGSGAKPHSINLGAHAIDASGKIVYNDLARAFLPQISPGDMATVTIRLPLATVLGHRVELLPVEEGVAWFNKWGSKPLTIGPFLICAQKAMGKVCDASGRAIPFEN